jgi:penicillin-binding protein 1A
MAKRPSASDNPDSTIQTDDSELPEELLQTLQPQKKPPASHDDGPANDGATAFVRLDQVVAPTRRAAPTAPRAPVPGPADEPANDGATAFVRLDQVASLPAAGRKPEAGPPPRRVQDGPPPQSAPRKGLQVTLPDEEPTAPPPPPKRVIAQPPADAKKGRRGAWWEEEGNKIPDEPPPPPPPEPVAPPEPSTDDAAGATAFVRVAPPPPPKPPPPRAPKPAPEPYRPVPASDYQGHLSAEPPVWKKWVRRSLIASALIAFVGAAAIIGGYFWISREVPTFDSIRDYHPIVTSRVVTSDGTVVGQFYRERRTVVKMDQIPRVLVQAVISAEDKDFYKHSGFNPIALLRAVVVDALSGRKRLGASTITQQVVKNFFLSSEKKWKRKLKELLLAARLERNLSKDDILFLYLNHINFGKAHYGVEEASLYYFNKHVQDIDLGEAAILAGLPQNPSRINPRRHPDRAKHRRDYVLARMLANHFISEDDYQRETDRPIVLPLPPPDPPGAWYLEEVRRQLVAQFGDAAVDTAGLTIEVAMDPKLQAVAETAVQDSLRAVDKRQGFRGPELKIDADRLEATRAALGRKLAQVQPSADVAQVLDLEGIRARSLKPRPKAAEAEDEKPAPGKKKKKPAVVAEDADPGEAEPAADSAGDAAAPERMAPEAIARAARVRPLEQNGVYAGIVTAVTRGEATVELAPGVDGPVPFSAMTWARPFKPEHSTPAPRSPADVLSVGDVVAVRVNRFSTTRDSATHVRVQRMELSLEQTPLVQGAFVGMDLRTRGVLALVGGFDAATSAFNRATQAKRQPGSSFKPFLYAAALDGGKYTPVTKMDDSPEVITDPWSGKSWKPQNFERDEFAGPITLRKALAESKNTVAVKLLLELGLDKVRSMALAAGLTSEIPQSYTAALGTGEVGLLEETNAYATIASLGRREDPVFIRKVVSRDGSTMFEAKSEPQQAMKAETAYLTADLMRSVIDDPAGTAHSLALGRPAAGKTGTASEHRDGWFIGFTPSLVAGAWVGFDDHRMMGSIETGGHCAGPIWLSWMRAATSSQPREEWPSPPPGVTAVKVNRTSGALARDSDPYAVREVFMAGTEPAAAAEQQQAPSQEDWYQAPH